jgi:nucleotide-binding universal stress UspA family protein
MSWLPKKTVLVPTDFSEPSVEAIHTALGLVEAGSDVHVLYVLRPMDFVSPGVLLGDIGDESRISASHDHLVKFLKGMNVDGVTVAVVVGDPGHEIAAYAKENAIELIVMPSHGYHGLKHVLLGSVAERVLRHATCPILMLRRTDSE